MFTRGATRNAIRKVATASAPVIVLLIGFAVPLLAGPSLAVAAEPPRAEDVTGFLAEAAPLCAVRPAADCIDSGWRFADRNGDDRLGLEEVNGVRDAVQRWFLGAREDLPRQTNAGIAVGLLALQLVGVSSFHRSYDTDGDGQVTRSEALADLTLDRRPLPLLLQDRAAVDWPRFLERLGVGAAMIDDLLPERPAPQ
ncbi:hypothetical protein [Algihabitans albus]|uniref:hypothetical protein n=1 Tax=Algihabitans albus TaxID=2164067 RepID=UPI000E5D4057|nr:hypothetical protein [Algihabitans albus]